MGRRVDGHGRCTQADYGPGGHDAWEYERLHFPGRALKGGAPPPPGRTLPGMRSCAHVCLFVCSFDCLFVYMCVCVCVELLGRPIAREDLRQNGDRASNARVRPHRHRPDTPEDGARDPSSAAKALRPGRKSLQGQILESHIGHKQAVPDDTAPVPLSGRLPIPSGLPGIRTW